jgi:hypothetical protein
MGKFMGENLFDEGDEIPGFLTSREVEKILLPVLSLYYRPSLAIGAGKVYIGS